MRVYPPALSLAGNLQGIWTRGLGKAPLRQLSPRSAPCASKATSLSPSASLSASSRGENNTGMAEHGSRLQDLYTLAKTAFSGQRIPSKPEIQKLLEAMCAVPLDELGLGDQADRAGVKDASEWRFSAEAGERGLPPVTYLPVKEEDDLHVGIFCLPANAEIPLHDHPGMTVLSRLLYGKMHVRAYDWVAQQEQEPGRFPITEGPARLVMDGVLGESGVTSVLYPNWANIHSFKAITPCAVLDILSPPYEPEDGRDCTYYRELLPLENSPHPDELNQGEEGGEKLPVAELEECDPPPDFIVRRGVYNGVIVNGWEE